VVVFVGASVLVVPEDSIGVIREQIADMQMRGRVGVFGPNPIRLEQVSSLPHKVSSADGLHHSYRFALSAMKLAQWVADNPDVLMDVFVQNGSAVVAKFGLRVEFNLSHVNQFVFVRRQVVSALLAGVAEMPVENPSWAYSSAALYRLLDDRLHTSFSDNNDVPLLQRSVWAARRHDVMNQIYHHLDFRERDGSLWFELTSAHSDMVTAFSYSSVLQLLSALRRPASVATVADFRRQFLDVAARRTNQLAVQRKQIASENFAKYWERVKSSMRAVVPDVDDVMAQFSEIPLLPVGSKASRTWGIEVETVHAERVQRPVGWDETSDGSLETDCSCDNDCERCYDGYHEDCNYCESGETAEYVSPVLSSFNSSGLRQITDSLETVEDNTSPGIHVHVGADDLSVTDVARLLQAYSAVEPLFAPIYFRQTRGYCNPMSANNVRFWLSQARDFERNHGRLPSNARELASVQPDSRYQDVNTQALSKHGTIEFRAMGPYYDYAHLVRWAWFVREMVNVCRLGLPVSVWTSCRSVTDVINVLRQYGSEMPLDVDADSLGDELAYEE
jgi:hypothetical protein